jgi:hypothetical protein
VAYGSKRAIKCRMKQSIDPVWVQWAALLQETGHLAGFQAGGWALVSSMVFAVETELKRQ